MYEDDAAVCRVDVWPTPTPTTPNASNVAGTIDPTFGSTGLNDTPCRSLNQLTDLPERA